MPEDHPTLHTPASDLPTQDRFVGREALLEDIHAVLSVNRPAGQPYQVVLCGHGGVGKTAAAVHYGWAQAATYPGGVYFLTCAEADPPLVLAGMADRLEVAWAGSPELTARAVKRRLEEKGKPALLILDNVARPEHWKQWTTSRLLPGPPARWLITSRDPIPGVKSLRVAGLDMAEGAALLGEFREDAKDQENREAVEGLVTWFDGLAVGLTVVGSYMADNPEVTWAGYSADVTRADGLDRYRSTEETHLPIDYRKRVGRVFDDLLASAAADERRTLEYAALLPEDRVVADWLTTLLKADGVQIPVRPGYADKPVTGVVDQLARRRLLVPRGEEKQLLTVHRILRRHLRERLRTTASEWETMGGRVVDLLCSRVTSLDEELGDYGSTWELTPLVLAFIDAVRDHPDIRLISAANVLSVRLTNLARFAEGHRLQTTIQPYSEVALGPDHPDTVASLNNLGHLLQALGDLAGARPYLERALAVREKALGPDDLVTTLSLNNLAYLLQAQGDYPGARPYYERALAVREKALGPDHPATAESLNNLGHLLNSLGDYAGARPYYERALAIHEEARGPDHPDTAASLNNLGYLLQVQGDPAGARPYYERALAVREKALGPDHPVTAQSLNNLGALLDALGDPAGAWPHLERALAVYERALGPDHPDTAASLNNLGSLLQDQGDLAGARPYYERALAVCEKALGPDHPDTAARLNNLGHLLQAQGDSAGARPYLERALLIKEKALGPDHPDTALSLNSLGYLLQAQGDLAGARPYYERALAVHEKALGPDHPDTAASLNNLGSLVQDQGDLAGARPHLERALAVRERVLGPDHQITADSLNNLGSLLKAQGDPAGARSYFERALAVRERVLGPDHPSTFISLVNLGSLLVEQKDWDAALPYLGRAQVVHEKIHGSVPERPARTSATGMTPDWQLPPGTDRGLWDYVQSSRIAREYDAALAGTPLLELDLRFADRHFPTPGRLIDLGCGTGRLVMHFAPRGYACTGVDLSDAMLDVLAEKAAVAGVVVERIKANLVELDVIPDASFDYAACLFSTLGMIRGAGHRAKFLAHVRRLLKPAGVFVLHAHNARYRFGRGLGRRGPESGDHTMPQHRGGADLTLHHFTRPELVRDLSAAGFQITELLPVSARPDGRLPAPWFWPGVRAYGYLVACRLSMTNDQ